MYNNYNNNNNNNNNNNINKLVPRIFVENWKSWMWFSLTVFVSGTWLSLVSVWKNYWSFSKLPLQKTVKDIMFLGWVSESIRNVISTNSQFKFCTRNFSKSEFVVNVEKLIWQTQEVMTKLQIVVDLRNKTFLHY